MENNKYFKQFVDRLDVNQKALDRLKENEITTLGELSSYKKSQLKDMGLVKKQLDGIKVLGNGELTKKLTVKASMFSKTAKEKIEKNGGKAEVI